MAAPAPFGGVYYSEAPVPFSSFEERLEVQRALVPAVPPVGPIEQRFLNDNAERRYSDLSLRGFIPQGVLDPRTADAREALSFIARVEWTFTVVHTRPFCAKVVRECLANLRYSPDGVIVRGTQFAFTPAVINDLFQTPSYLRSFDWENGNMNLAISSFTNFQHNGWTGFTLSALTPPFNILYRACELNWLPGLNTNANVKRRILLVWALVNRREIDFGELMYEQVMEQTRDLGPMHNIALPNFIYQVLELQKEIPRLPGDDTLIGRPETITGNMGELQGPRRGRVRRA